jgi:hypothetical protein
MKPKKIIGLILLIGGLVLLYFGYQSSQGLDDQVSRALTGRFTDNTVVFYAVGAISAIVGLVMTTGRR